MSLAGAARLPRTAQRTRHDTSAAARCLPYTATRSRLSRWRLLAHPAWRQSKISTAPSNSASAIGVPGWWVRGDAGGQHTGVPCEGKGMPRQETEIEMAGRHNARVESRIPRQEQIVHA